MREAPDGRAAASQLTDPLLKARSARRLALWRSIVLHPLFVLGAAALIVGCSLKGAWPIGVGLVVAGALGAAAWADSAARREWWPLLLQQLA